MGDDLKDLEGLKSVFITQINIIERPYETLSVGLSVSPPL